MSSILAMTVFVNVDNPNELRLMDVDAGVEVMRQAVFAVATGSMGLTVQKEDVVVVDVHTGHDPDGCEQGCLQNMYRDEKGNVTR